MSFDLAVWRDPGRRITSDEASATYAAMCARPFDSFVPSQEMAAFVQAVAARLVNDEGSPEASPWAAEPDVDQDSVIMAFRSPIATEALPVVRELAHDRGLICFDPQASQVYQRSESASDESTSLELHGGRKFVDPSEALIEKSIRGISRDRWFAILELGKDRYIQVGYGENAGVPSGQYALEYRDGSRERHWRATTPDLEACVRAFLEYRAGEMNWIKRLSFRQLDL